MKTIELQFDGYWREPNKGSVPSQSGIYCVYACKHLAEKKQVSIRKLLYIGESSDVNKRIQNHDRHDDWVGKLYSDEILCYSFAPVPTVDRERAEAALIFQCQPPLNTEHTGSFIYEDTEIVISGKCACLPADAFTIEKGATR